MLLAAPVITLAVLGLTAPGILWALCCYPSGSYATRVVVGLALGLAFQWHLCALLAAGPGITPMTVALSTGGGLLLAGALVWRSRSRFPIRHIGYLSKQPRHTQRTGHTRYTLLLVAILAVSAAIRIVPLAVHTIPQGWDPSFHVLLASTTVATGHLPSWTPYEQIPLNYPYGPHVFIAEVSLVTGIAPDQVFGVLLSLLTPLATGLALYAFSRQVWRSAEAALGAVAAYALLGNWGSLDYGRWGGLPNALGFFLLLAFLLVFFARGNEWTRVLVGGLLLGAVPLAHHHVALTTALLLVGYGICLAVLALVWRRQARGWAALRQLRRLSMIAMVAFVSVSYYAVPYALRARDVQSSEVLRYFDHSPGIVFDKNGWLLWLLAVAGGSVLIFRGFQRFRRRQPFRPQRHAALAFTVVATVLLALAFVLGYYGYRAYSLHVYHQPYTAFTPTRFLTDLTYFLAILAGPPLVWLWQRTGSTGWRRSARGMRFALRAGLALTLIVTACMTMVSQLAPDEGHLAAGEAAAFTWIQRHTPTNTIVINLNPTDRWAPYFTQREVTNTPVPVSEFTTGYVANKRYLADVLLSLLRHDRLVAFAADGTAFPALASRPVALISDSRLPSAWDATLRYRNESEQVYLLGSAFGRLLTPTDSALWWHGRQPPASGWQTTTNTTGWSAQLPTLPHANGTLYLRLTVAGGSPSPLRVSCAAQEGGQLFIDGKRVPDTCAGSWQTFPELTAPGPHTLAFKASAGRDLGPWFAVAVVTGNTR